MSDDRGGHAVLHAVVEKLAKGTFGDSVTLGDRVGLGGSNRSNVWRWQLKGDNVPDSVVVKQVSTEHESYDPDSPKWGPAHRLFNEWTALQLLTERQATFIPKLFSSDRDAGVLMIEDLGTAPTLDQLLLGDDAQVTEKALIALAEVLGQMHALTTDSRADYDQLRTNLGPTVPPPDTAKPITLAETEIKGLLTKIIEPLEIKLTSAMEAELKALTVAWRDANNFRVLIHSDPCPDNILVVGDTVKLVDFEFARFGSPLIDGTYWRTFFPTCWCCNRLPVLVADQMETHYRDAMVRGLPDLKADDRYYRLLVEACLSWTFTFLNWEGLDPVADDGDWGIATIRQRVLMRFEVVAALADEHRYYPAVGDLSKIIAEALRERWSPPLKDLPLYPTFQ